MSDKTFSIKGQSGGTFSFPDKETKETMYMVTLAWMGGSKNFIVDKKLFDRFPEEDGLCQITGSMAINPKGQIKLVAEQVMLPQKPAG